MTTDLDIPISDYLAIRNLAFEWSESYDTKDWPRLRLALAPSVSLDFRSLRGELHDSLSPDEYVAILSSTKLLGDPRMKTQHFLGASKWESLCDGSVQVDHQIRVAHQRYKDEDLLEVVNKGHGHGVTRHVYRKVTGSWKIVGVAPSLNWFEYDLFGTLNPQDG
ncbi:Scytalone dehydratase [Lophiostoma macrostomum CBS 122681]|uniref:Scytalone dehydratase n=1 Tax=Lophiostoma macrostomum CBS 122681 TaxID=1314788 RepID=A0A6A6T492_9PLEO|nr:Scytalone dehydratase [Lophiostoma macrostomum CBS 122681]